MLLDEAGERISPDAKSVPQGRMTRAQAAALFTTADGTAGDTADQALHRAALPLVRTMLGITGGVVK